MSKIFEPIETTDVAGVPKTKTPSILRSFDSINLAVSMIALVLSTYPSSPWNSKHAQVQAIVLPALLPLTVGLL